MGLADSASLMFGICVIAVSILVLMDGARRPYHQQDVAPVFAVSILVLMDGARRLMEQKPNRRKGKKFQSLF